MEEADSGIDLDDRINNKVVQTMSRRRFFTTFLPAAVFAGISTATALKIGIDWLLTPAEIALSERVLRRELKDDLGLGELGKTRSEFFTLWPRSRIWVVANNVLAARILNGQVLKKDERYSLIDLLGIDRSQPRRIDLGRGYLAGLGLSEKPPFLTLVESQGLCLTSCCFARALVTTAASFQEWNTHLEIDEVTINYFDSRHHLIAHPAFQKLGTDAAIFCSEKNPIDLRFTPLEDLAIRYKIMDINGRKISLESPDLSLQNLILGYPKSLTKRLPVPLLVRCAVGCQEGSKYSVAILPTLEKTGGENIPGFDRILRRSGKTVLEESVKARYNDQGHYLGH